MDSCVLLNDFESVLGLDDNDYCKSKHRLISHHLFDHIDICLDNPVTQENEGIEKGLFDHIDFCLDNPITQENKGIEKGLFDHIDFCLDNPITQVDEGIERALFDHIDFCLDNSITQGDEENENRKDDFIKMTRDLRSLASRHFDFGTSGIFGGVDGEFGGSVMFQAIQQVMKESALKNSMSYGVDLGHGSATALFATYNYGLKLNMIGIEVNDMRYLYSIRFQALLSNSSCRIFTQLASMSILFHGSAASVLKERLSFRPQHLWLIYWFSQGWGSKDIIEVIKYLNHVPNIEWIITDLSFDKLVEFGFTRKIRSRSNRYGGRMYRSSNSRSIFVHHLIQVLVYDGTTDLGHDKTKEFEILRSFYTQIPIEFAQNNIFRLEERYASRNRSGRGLSK